MNPEQQVKSEPAQKPIFVRKKHLKNELEYVNAQIYSKNKELADTNKVLALMRNIDSLTLESHDSLKNLASQICGAIVGAGDYSFVGLLTNGGNKQLHFTGWSAGNIEIKNSAILETVRINPELPWLNDSVNSAFVNLQHLPIAKIAEYLDIGEAQVKKLKIELGLNAVFVIKMIARAKLVGLLVVGFKEHLQTLTATDENMLPRIAGAVGVAIDNKLLFEENQRVLKQLQHSNTKLKELDEAKDEFISMASHQLRTPLTSMKGYVDMVIQGDAGKATAEQVKLLKQAFASSQKMVYLISDLLNVSRLKTGKFVIEPVATNLAETVAGEVEQLSETAKGRNLKLIYKKPAKFPTLMLDETKVRQVIMNFIDNAIYYTPAGGSITVALKDLPKSVELTVTDTGLGVPKADQPKLFGKFFRAGNAQKARPDGTGLGLFMAKKVVIAQGGAIIFKSTEGKGSTFGFSFPKDNPAIKVLLHKLPVVQNTANVK